MFIPVAGEALQENRPRLIVNKRNIVAMKKIIQSILLILLVSNASLQAQKINDPNVELRTLSGSFHAIEVSNAIDLYLSQSDQEALAVSASQVEHRNRIKTRVENGVLKIWYENDGKFWKGNNKKLKAYVSFKNIDRLQSSGASDVYTEGSIKVNELTVRFSGASDFSGSIFANQLTVDISGASDMKLKGGKVTKLNIEASGASDFVGYELIADDCSANASGASSIYVTVNNELSVRASGASDVFYKGSGRIRDLKSSGASSVGRKS